MATNFKRFIVKGAGYRLEAVDTPLDGRTIIESKDEIIKIPYPYIGMIFYVKNENKFYYIKTLKTAYVTIDEDWNPIEYFEKLEDIPDYENKMEWVDYMLIENYYADEYEEFGGSTGDGVGEEQSYTNEKLVLNGVGGIQAGESFDDVPLTDMWNKLLYPDQSPDIVNIIASTEPGLQDKNIPLESLTFDIEVAKTTNDLVSLALFDGENEIETKDLTNPDVVTDDNIYNFNVESITTENPLSEDKTFSIKLTDSNGLVTSKELVYDFISPIYTGVSDSEVLEESEILLSTKLVVEPDIEQNVTCEDKYDFICYPEAFGDLVNIIEDNGFKTLNSYTKSEVTVNGENYFVYANKNKYTVENYNILYKFNI